MLNLHRHLKPCVFHDLIDTLTKKQPNQQDILSVDGKKIRSGLTETDGDVDLFGTENSPTIGEQRERLAYQIKLVDELIMELTMYNIDFGLRELSNSEKECLCKRLQIIAKAISTRIQEARNIRKAKEYRSRCLMKQVPENEDWRTSTNSYAISAINCEILQLSHFITNALNGTRQICLIGRALREWFCEANMALNRLYCYQK